MHQLQHRSTLLRYTPTLGYLSPKVFEVETLCPDFGIRSTLKPREACAALMCFGAMICQVPSLYFIWSFHLVEDGAYDAADDPSFGSFSGLRGHVFLDFVG
jgi:hypothetical protein